MGWISRQRKDVAVLGGVLALLGAAAGLTLLAPAPAEAGVVPNDAGFAVQWADENTGQPIRGQVPARGDPFADESTADAWQVTTGDPSVVVGETDTGVDYAHPDLAANIWSNPGGIGGCLPGTHGFNVLRSPPENCEPIDEDAASGGAVGHGTHVAGIIGAAGNNGIGVAGVNWHTTILPVKWVDDAEVEREPALLVKALEKLLLAKQEGVNIRVVNDSPTFMGSTKPYVPLREKIEELGERGILFVTAAGNAGESQPDVDEHPRYPCSYHLPNEICVTATNNRDELPKWASWGPNSVDLGAPGAGIYSTLRQKTEALSEEANYGYLSGTSMAAAQVSGAAALILSVAPWLTPSELKSDILSHVDRLKALEGKVSSGGRLDVCEALPRCLDLLPPPPAPPPAAPPAKPAPPPVLSALTIAPSSFRAARSGASISSARAGAFVSYRDTQPALTELSVLAPRPGVLNKARRCVAAPQHRSTHGHHKSCLRYLRVGRFSRVDTPGANRFHFSGRVGRGRLAPGRYRLQAVPAFAAQTGAGAGANFRIIS